MARGKPKRGQAGSKGYQEAKRHTAKLHKKIARQREDTSHKWAEKVVRDHDRLAVEDLRPKCLAKSTMALPPVFATPGPCDCGRNQTWSKSSTICRVFAGTRSSVARAQDFHGPLSAFFSF